jgi:hypothetical protein
LLPNGLGLGVDCAHFLTDAPGPRLVRAMTWHNP